MEVQKQDVGDVLLSACYILTIVLVIFIMDFVFTLHRSYKVALMTQKECTDDNRMEMETIRYRLHKLFQSNKVKKGLYAMVITFGFIILLGFLGYMILFAKGNFTESYKVFYTGNVAIRVSMKHTVLFVMVGVFFSMMIHALVTPYKLSKLVSEYGEKKEAFIRYLPYILKDKNSNFLLLDNIAKRLMVTKDYQNADVAKGKLQTMIENGDFEEIFAHLIFHDTRDAKLFEVAVSQVIDPVTEKLCNDLKENELLTGTDDLRNMTKMCKNDDVNDKISDYCKESNANYFKHDDIKEYCDSVVFLKKATMELKNMAVDYFSYMSKGDVTKRLDNIFRIWFIHITVVAFVFFFGIFHILYQMMDPVQTIGVYIFTFIVCGYVTFWMRGFNGMNTPS